MTEIDTYCRKWEFFKFKVRSLSIKFSKIRCHQQKENEMKLVQSRGKNKSYSLDWKEKTIIIFGKVLKNYYSKPGKQVLTIII